MAELAGLQINADSGSVVLASKNLDDLSASAGKAERATDLLSGSHDKAASATGLMQAGIEKAIQAEEVMVESTRELSIAQNLASQAMSNHGAAATAFRPAVVGVVGALEPLLAILGPLAVGIGGFTYLWLEGEKSAKIYEDAVTGVGRVAGLTADDLRELTEANAEAGRLSVQAAQEMAASYLQTGNVGREQIGDLLRITQDFADFTGTEAPAALRALSDAMEDPIKAGHDMTESFGLLTLAEIDQIAASVKAGDQDTARGILMQNLDGVIDAHKTKVSEITSLWEYGVRQAQNFIHWAGQAAYVDESEKLQNSINARYAIERTGGPRDASQRRVYDEAGARALEIQRSRQRRADDASEAQANQAALAARDRAEEEARRRRTPRAASSGATRRIRTPRVEPEVQRLEREPSHRIRDLGIEIIKLEDPMEQVIRDMGKIDDLARGASRGLAESFGESGRALGDLLTTMTGYEEQLARIQLAENEHRLTATQANRERGASEMQMYGDMASAAKGFFGERTGAYRALQAAEQAFRAVQFAMAVQAMILDTTETGSSVANAGIRMASQAGETASSVLHSGIRAAASAAEAVARVFAQIPFPFNIAAAAGLVAVMASFGVKMLGGGGGGGGSAKSASASAETAQTAIAQNANARTTAAQAIASQVNVVVTADRQGMNAYVKETATGVATPMAIGAYRESVSTSREIVPQDQAQKGSMMLRAGRR